MNKSIIFKAYNLLTHQAKLGRIDRHKLNQALGICLMKEARPYTTTMTECSCPWFVSHEAGFPPEERSACKHQIALVLMTVAKEVADGLPRDG